MPERKRAPKGGFSAAERAAMRERAAEARGAGTGEEAVLAKIAELPPSDRVLARRVHELIRAAVPELEPRTWYGMPAYAKDGRVLCYLQPPQKFKTRYATLGFSDKAQLDDGPVWPVAFALAELTPEAEERLVALVRRAAGVD